VLRSTLENHFFYLTQSDTASINVNWISVTQGESHTTVLSRDASEFLDRRSSKNQSAVVRNVHVSACFGEKQTLSSQSQRRKGPSRLSSETDAKANFCNGTHQCKPQGWLTYSWRYLWRGGEVSVLHRSTYSHLRWDRIMKYHSSCVKTELVCSPDLSIAENTWPIVKRRFG